ncbi:hypothetical protein LZQ00_07990 [Sphingobacterium sp. SRCM116780]|uniref:hypothetical protein n=1 Tax=Sphingobacterium sp. SRCM116780 TaxID=2907623 RepID=UPI001F4745FD|nr:hypothetical protein [Sphingobacterium sp. SRCM116780]UIR57752.1 hypothetical protein LZQ00_07990 [Sphingobacterium sp. SRCM116780]
MIKILKKNTLTLAISFLFTLQIKAQNVVELPNVIPPSPNAQTFIKYGNFPVSNYTGVPDISVPIYNISLKDITLPITLSYNSSGIRVEEEASRVGLGWVLNAGGLITHNIRESNDFYSYDYLNNPADNDLPDLKGINPNDYTIKQNYQFILHNPNANSSTGTNPLDNYYRVVQDPVNKTAIPFSLPSNLTYDKFIAGISSLYNDPELGYDFEPDIFNYNFLGYSGKFIVLRNGQVLKEKEDNLKIEYTVNSTVTTTDVASWKVTTPDGTKYYFNETEKVKFVDRPQKDTHNSSFYLTKIETINGSIISLNYKKNNMLLGTFSRSQDSRDLGKYVQSSTGYYEVVYLDNIQFAGGSVRFEYKFDREDNEPEPRLKTIYIDDEYGSNKHKWEFIQNYFNANVSGVDLPTLEQLNLNFAGQHYYIDAANRGSFSKSWNEKRLRLDEIWRTNTDNQPEVYKLTYNEDKLPSKLSSSIDHWGYYNGANNLALIPDLIQFDSYENGMPKFNYGGYGANREANAEYNKAFILEKITYPTGGQTQFAFEPNRFHTDNFENDSYKRNLMYTRESNSFTESQANGLNNMPHQLKSFIVANSSKKFNISVEFVLDQYLYTGDPSLEISIKKDINDLNPLFKYTLHGNNFLPAPPVSENKKMTYISEDILIPPGNYIFMVGGSLFKQLKSITASATGINGYPEDYIKKNYLGIGGGLRINMINNYDRNNKFVSGKSFKYTTNYFRYDYYSPGFSSGKLMFYPRYMKNRLYQTSDGGRGNGFSVGYSSVYVTDVDLINGSKNGVALYEYINKPDKNLYYNFKFSDSNYAYDINPSGVEGFKYQENGTLLRDSLFREENQSLKPVKTTEYIYNILEKNIAWGINKSRYTTTSLPYLIPNGDIYTHENNTQVTRLNFLYPALRPIWVRLDQKKETIFENGVPIESIMNYTYNPTYNYITKEELKSGTEVLKTIDYKYPPDITGNSVVNKLTETNRISIPIETKQTINGKFSQVINDYALFNSVPQLSTVKSNTGVNKTIEPRIIYHLYDTYGNPTQVSMDASTTTVYIWGYIGQYPVAKIENATYAEVLTALGSGTIATNKLDALNANGVTAETINSTIQLLRANLPKSQVSTYTYKPLVGMTSKTDPRGVTEYYNYDGMQRLQVILDQFKNVNKSFDYHYNPN